MRYSRTLAVVGLVVLVAVAGCSGGGSAPGSGNAGEMTKSAGGSGGASSGAAPTTAAGTSDGTPELHASAQGRYRVRTATASVRVTDFEAASSALVAKAKALGGYVGSSTQERHRDANRTWTTGTVVLRVPAENGTVLLAAVRASGNVTALSTDTTDVTKRVVDLRARIDNLRAQRVRLREMYNRTNSTEEALTVQRRLSDVQGQIEQLQGELDVLTHQVAYSTVTVHLREPQPEAPPASATRPGIVTAFFASVHGVVEVANLLALFVAYATPYVVAFGVPIGVVAYGARRYRRRGPG